MGSPSLNKSIFLVGLEKFSLIILQFFTSIILARLLTPEDFGTVAMLAIFISLAELLVDAGFGGSLIYYQDVDEKDFSTIFWINVVISLILYSLMVLFAPLIADFYDSPILKDIIDVLGFVIVFQSLGFVQYTLLYKKLEYKKLLYVSLLSYLLSAILAVLLAINGFGVWSLVAQQVSAMLFRTIILFCYNRFIPKLYFSWELVKKHWTFGCGLFFSSITRIVYDNMYLQLIGKFCSITETGYYNQANKLKEIPSGLFSRTFETAIFPIFSMILDDKIFSEKFRILNNVYACLSAPLFFIISICSFEIVHILLGEKWENSSWILSWLSVGAIFYIFEAVNRSILKAKGQAKLIFKIDLIKRCLSIFLMFVLIYAYGISGLVFTFCFNCLFGWIVNAYYNGRFCYYSFKEQTLDVMRYSLICGIIAIIVSSSCKFFPITSQYISLVIKGISFLFIYIMELFLVKDQSLNIIVKYIKKRRCNQRTYLTKK